MAYCQNCGEEINENADVCLKCGAAVKKTAQVSANDTGSFGWSFLGFCIPLVGLILYLVWKETQPLNSKAAGKGALIGFIVMIIFYIIYFAVIAAALSAY